MQVVAGAQPHRNNHAQKVAVIVPVMNAMAWLPEFIRCLQMQSPAPGGILFVDSASTDGTPAELRFNGYAVHCIARADFNHGGTRRLATTLVDADIYVFLTQDALLDSVDAIAKLVAAFDEDKTIGAAYGRQLPHCDAKPLGTHARFFNYPVEAATRSLEDAARLGVKTCFSSDSFAAYRREALEVIGGFPTCVIGTEDAYVVGKMLLNGWRVHYASDACVRHSHDYSLAEQFRRYFDIGVFYGQERWIGEHFGKAGGEGLRFVVSEIKFLARRHKLYLIPYALLQSATKAMGYKLGKYAHKLPKAVVRKISMNPNYWNQIDG